MVDHVGRWLEGLGLGRYAELFAAQEITAEILPELSDTDLKELGLPLGARKRILKAMEAQVLPRAAAAEPAPAGGAERRQLTLMFVDLVGSTALSGRLDPEELGSVLSAYQKAVAGEIAPFGGHVAKFMGDGVLAYFGWPRAHEGEAERAVRAGLAVVSAVARLSGGEAPLACRIGIATGLVVVGELIGEGAAQEQAVVGETPNLAARLQALAKPGQVVVAASTRALLGAGFQLDPLGEHALKGIEGAVAAFAVTGERLLASRFEGRTAGLQPMVGRDQELALLLERWSHAEAGEGQAVLLLGEAGIGKSRLTRALLDALRSEPHVRIRYQCSPFHTGSAFWPVIQQLSRAANVAADDTADGQLDKLEALLARAGDTTAAPLLASLLGLDGSERYGTRDLPPHVERARTLGALVRQLIGLAEGQPVLLVVEDAHWIDPTTLELIAQTLEACATSRLLAVITSRPERQPSLGGHLHVTQLSLNRLGRDGVKAIVAGVGGGRLPRATIDAIIASSDGVPLYAEELTRTVVETGDSTIPPSLHDSLMARLDRLAEVKLVAQTAACIGREFEFSLLADISDDTEVALVDALQALTTAELVFRRGTPPAARYSFKHALVRDAAYESLLKQHRRAIHQRIATSLQRRAGAAMPGQPERVAWHLTEAGDIDAALPYWLAAGRGALARLALKEALGHLETALRLAARLAAGPQRDRHELEARVALAGVHFAAKGWPAIEVRDVLEPAVALSQHCGDIRSRMLAEWYLCLHHFVRCETEAALARIASMSETATATDDPAFQVATYCQGACAHVFAGNFAVADGYAEQLETVYDLERDGKLALVLNHEPKSWALTWMAFALIARGRFGAALAAVESQLAIARALDLPWNSIWALTGGSDALSMAGANDRHLSQIETARELAARHAADFALAAICPCHEGIARVLRGDFAAGYRALTAGTKVWNDSGGSAQNPLLHTLRALALVHLGRAPQAIQLLRQTIEFVERTGHKTWWPEHHRVLGNALMAGADPDIAAATASYETAIDLARAMQALTYELKASHDLARLRAERGERRQAQDLLAPVYGRFTEGFDTPDLQAAKGLIEALG